MHVHAIFAHANSLLCLNCCNKGQGTPVHTFCRVSQHNGMHVLYFRVLNLKQQGHPLL